MNIKIKQLLKLNETQFNVLKAIHESSSRVSIIEIKDKVNKDRTTVQKVLTAIEKEDYIVRDQVNLERGFCFLYRMSKNFNRNICDLIDKKILALKKLKEEIQLE